jgi:hypothetical protein
MRYTNPDLGLILSGCLVRVRLRLQSNIDLLLSWLDIRCQLTSPRPNFYHIFRTWTGRPHLSLQITTYLKTVSLTSFLKAEGRRWLWLLSSRFGWLCLSWKWKCSVRFGYSSERAADVTLDERTNKMRALQQRIVPLPSRSSRWNRLLLLLLAWMDRDMLVFWSYQKGVALMCCMLLRDGMFGF